MISVEVMDKEYREVEMPWLAGISLINRIRKIQA